MWLQKIYSKMNEFRECDRLCDITVEVQGKSFQCHRLLLAAASEFFDVMFGSNFLEGRTNNIVLKDIEALSFEQVLCFIYTGTINFTKDNVFGILCASRFFQIVSLEEECIHFIRKNLPVCEMLEVFKYANLIDKKSLIGCTSRYIMEHFDEFVHDRLFLELHFEDLCTLIENRLYLSTENERPFVNAIFRWVNHKRDTRARELEEILKKYLPEESEKSELLKLVQFDGSAESSEYTDCADLNVLFKPKLDLHLYLQCIDETIGVYSFNSKISRGEISCSVLNIFDTISVAGVGNHLYCLTSYNFEPVFQACPSVDFTFESPANRRLQSPPSTCEYASMICNTQNKIYLNDAGQFSQMKLPVEFLELRPEYCEYSSKRIYVYDIDMDKWFCGPDPEVNPLCSTIVTYNDVLYLVYECGGLVQALDDRTSKWRKLNSNNDNKEEVGNSIRKLRSMCSCVHDGKIYACNALRGVRDNIVFQRYDVTASKWENITPPRRLFSYSSKSDWSQAIPRKLISYENFLWAVRDVGHGNIILETYNTLLDEWDSAPMPIPLEDHVPYFQEAVVFKPV